MSKAQFQAALQHSVRFAPLLNETLDEKINALNDIAQAAEDTFWDMARAEFEATGSVSAEPVNAAEDLTVSAGRIVQQVLDDFDSICNYGALEDDGITWTLVASVNSLYAPFVSVAATKLLALTERMRTLLANVHDNDSYQGFTGGCDEIYASVYQLLQQFGPNFPTPLTAFYSKATATYNRPKLSVEYALNGPSDIQAVFKNIIDSVDGSSSGSFACPASDTNYHVLEAGDTIYVAKLELDVTTFDHLVGAELLTVETTDASMLRLERGSLDINDEVILPVLTEAAEDFGDVFELRKIRGV